MSDPFEGLIHIRVLKNGVGAGNFLSDEEASLATSKAITAAMLDPEVWGYAADLIETGMAVKQTLAVNAAGDPLPIDHEDACGFCILGAVTRAAFDLHHLERPNYNPDNVWMCLVNPVTAACGLPRSANFWNNQAHVTQDDVVAALRSADPERIPLR